MYSISPPPASPGYGPARLRVLHLNERLSARGGADRHLVAVLARLQGRLQTLLAVGHHDQSLPPDELARIGPWRRLKGLDRSGLTGRGGRAARRRLEGLLAEFAPDVIHLHNVMDPELIAAAAQAAPAVMTVQDHRLFCPGRGQLTPQGRPCTQVLGEPCMACFAEPDYGARLIALTRRRLQAAAHLARVLVLSSYMARSLAAAWQATDTPAPPLEVLPPPVDRLTPAPRRGPGRYHLLAGRLVARKGIEVALEAAARLQEPLPLVVAGDGPLAGRVRRAGVQWVGWADRERMQALLTGARCLWLPSLWAEPFGIVGLEALALETPVIASRVGGVQDWLEPEVCGILVPPGDPLALAAAADRLARRPGLARSLGRAGRRRVERRFAPGPLMARLETVYRQVSAPAPPRPRGHGR